MSGTGSIFNFSGSPSPAPTATPATSAAAPQPHSIFNFGGNAPHAPAATGHSIFNFSGATPPAEDGGILGAGRKVASGLSSALNFQHDAAAQAMFHKGSPDANRAALRHAIPGFEAGYDDPRLFGQGGKEQKGWGVPVPAGVTHAVRGVEDAALDTATDPLTYETLGAGAAVKGVANLAQQGLKAITATPLGAVLHDFMRWGGEVARTHGEETVQHVRGAANLGSASGAAAQQHLVGQFKAITKGLHDDDKVAVAKALNGETPVAELAPHQQAAFNGLRQLTEHDYALRTQAAKRIAFAQVARALPAEDRPRLAQALLRGVPPGAKPGEQAAAGGTREAAQARPRTPERQAVVDAAAAGKPPSPEASSALQSAVSRLGSLSGKSRPAVAAASPAAPSLDDAAIRKLYDDIYMRHADPATAIDSHIYSHKDGAEFGTARVMGDTDYGNPMSFDAFRQHFVRPGPAAAAAAGDTRESRLRQAYDEVTSRVEKAMPKRQDYLPFTHEAEELDEGGSPARTMNMLDRSDPRSIQRESMHVTHAGQLDAGFNAMASNAGRQVERGLVHEALGDLVDDPAIHRLFDQTVRATGNKRTNWESLKDGWLNVVGYPRAATVSMTPRHAVNILDLLANTVGPSEAPGVLQRTMALAAKLTAAKTPEEAHALTQEGRELGALSGEYKEKTPFFQQFPKWVPGIGGKSTGPVGAYTRFNNKLVWAIDEAAKQEYAKLIVSRGEASGLRAGGLASSRLVDYAHHSPLVDKLKYVAPFATFRGSIPGAVLGGVARNPARAAFYNRLSGGTMYGDRPAPGAHGITLYNPTADVGRGIGAPQEYLRATLSQPVQGAATLGEEALAAGEPGASVKTAAQEARDIPRSAVQSFKDRRVELPQPRKVTPYARAVALRKARYLNYGNPIDLRWLLSASSAGVVEARDALEMMGMGQFRQKPEALPQRIEEGAAQQVLGAGVR